VLGAGSTFQVAIVERAGNRYICKRLSSRMRQEPSAQASLEREATLLARVRHPSLPELVDRGSDARGAFLIESWLEAPSLRRIADGYAARDRVMAPELMKAVMRAGFRALGELHALSMDGEPLELALGDVAPDHVLAARGRVWFVDFGQARYRGMPHRPPAGERGTLPYVAPEIARGESEPSQASDLWALAASFAFLALGREPCRAAGAAALLVELAERGLDLEALSESASLDEAGRGALERALDFDPARRLRDANAVLSLLRG
jgi:serine/threonine-protein kinase